ncbi:MAG: prepilin-type N-terminal cleavage/methylation domain-containing protein [Planctomycetes bacterium]|nr:prepilin-type N-terminal cleavage/methylation domain-containing protein [Planctomycetota bacterium]
MIAIHKQVGPARNRRRVRCGFTLVELVAAMTVMTILMMGMGSAMIIASRAIPNDKSPMSIATESRNVLDRLTEDLLYAISVSEKAATALTFTVADRGHGAAGPETIRYAWSGTPGDPLTLEYNGAPAVNLIDDIQDFTLSYAVKADGAGEVPLVEGAVETLFVHSGSNLPAGQLYQIGSGYIESQYFVPQLPADATSWSITSVTFIGLKAGGTNNSTLSVQVRSAVDSGSPPLHPDATVIDQVTIPESNLTGTWQQVLFSQATGLDPTRGYHIAFVANGSSMNLQVSAVSSPVPEARAFEWDPGSGWSEVGRSIWLSVSGKVTAPDPNGAPPGNTLLASVKIGLQIGMGTSTHTQTEVQILNAPDVSGL